MESFRVNALHSSGMCIAETFLTVIEGDALVVCNEMVLGFKWHWTGFPVTQMAKIIDTRDTLLTSSDCFRIFRNGVMEFVRFTFVVEHTGIPW